MIISDDIKEANVLLCQNHPHHLKKKKKDSLFERRETKILEGENWIVKVDEGGDPK